VKANHPYLFFDLKKLQTEEDPDSIEIEIDWQRVITKMISKASFCEIVQSNTTEMPMSSRVRESKVMLKFQCSADGSEEELEGESVDERKSIDVDERKSIGKESAYGDHDILKSFEIYAMRNYIRLCQIADTVIQEIYYYYSTPFETNYLNSNSLSVRILRRGFSLEELMDTCESLPQPRSKKEFIDTRQIISNSHHQKYNCFEDENSDSISKIFKKKLIKYNPHKEQSIKCSICKKVLTWHFVCKCGYLICMECFFLYDLYFAPADNSVSETKEMVKVLDSTKENKKRTLDDRECIDINIDVSKKPKKT
jgi:hypothetical protein